jgi:hypothetical protein
VPVPGEHRRRPFEKSAGNGRVTSDLETKDFCGEEKSSQVALGGADRERAEHLLESAQRQGAALLGTITKQAVSRMLAAGGSFNRKKALFNAQEKQQLAEAIASTNATADLLGRARIQETLRKAVKKHDPKRHAEMAERALHFFDDTQPPKTKVQPMVPEKALNYFQRLVPDIHVREPKRWLESLRRDSFTAAAATDQIMLEKFKGAIAERLESGNAATGPAAIQEILDNAGVSPRNPQYSEMLMRTNLMEAYNSGADQERQDPDVIADFPVWQYLGIADGRQRPSHAIHNDKFFWADVGFEEVRDAAGSGEFSGYNCRCNPRPVYKEEWKELEAGGARVSSI